MIITIIRKWFNVIVLFAICSLPVLASSVTQRIFTASDGLINGTVWDISFDDHGFAWLATEEGLYRVSSSKIRRVDRIGVERKLNDDFIKVVLPLSKRHLLVSSVYHIYLYDIYSNTFTLFGSEDLFPEYDGLGVVAEVEAENGHRVLLTTEGELLHFNYSAMSLERVNFLTRRPDHPWVAMAAIADNRIVVATQNHIEIRDISGVRLAKIVWQDRHGRIAKVFSDSNNRVWISSREGLFELALDSLSIDQVTQLPYSISHITEDSHGFLWLVSRTGLLKWRPDSMEAKPYGHEVQKKSNIDYVKDLAIDDMGLIWIAGSGNGVAVLADTPDFVLEQFSEDAPYNMADEAVWSIYTDSAGVWLGTDTGLSLIDKRTQHAYLIIPQNIDVNDRIYQIDALDDAHILLSSSNGLSVVNKHTFESQTFADWMGGTDSLEHQYIYHSYFDPLQPGRIWFATSHGLFFWEPGLSAPQPITLAQSKTKGLLQRVSRVSRDHAQNLWVGGDNLLGYLDKQNNFHSLTDQLIAQFGVDSINMISEIKPGVLWFGLKDHGVIEYNTHTKVFQSLTETWRVNCSNVYFFEQFKQYQLIGCPRSLIRFNKLTGEVVTLGPEDGLISDELNEGASNVTKDGLYVGTPDGAMLLDATQLTNRVANDTVQLESMEVFFDTHSEISLLPHGQPRILPGAQLISFQLARTNYLSNKPLQLRYRLQSPNLRDGSNSSFLNLDGQAQLNISGLEAGIYTLEVISLQNGVWSTEPFIFKFQVEVFWWQTLWFRSVILLGVFLLGLIILFIRQRQIIAFKGINSALKNSEERLKQALKGSDSDLWEWQRKTFAFKFENASRIFSSADNEVGVTLADLCYFEDDSNGVLSAWKDMLEERTERFEVEYRYIRKDNSVGWLRVLGRPVKRHRFNGEIEQVAGTYTDITEQRQLKDDVYLLAQAFENTSEAVLIYDKDERIQVTNKAAQQILACSADKLMGRAFSEVLIQQETVIHIADLLQHGLNWTGECNVACADDQQCAVWLNVSSILNVNGEATHYVVVFSDISARKQTEADLRRLANYDVLTALPNRSLFASKLSQSIYQAEKDNGKLALLFLDLDRFKHVNDSYGHSMGDALLVEASKRLQALITPGNVLCRFGGDEFVILLRNQINVDSINLLCEQLLASIAKPFSLFGREFYISTSIGVSLWPEDAKQSESLIKNADLAMYHAKDEGKGNFKYYSQDRNEEALYHLRLEADLRKAIEKEELELHFQPKINIQEGNKLVGVEALLRWHHPQDGYVRTDIFIKVAEACGLIVDIDRWVMREACRYGAHWSKTLAEPFEISVNISTLHFRQPDFIEEVESCLAASGMASQYLSLEITEGVLMKELDVAKHHLKKLKLLGVNVAIDDFGTGYSSLAYLRHFEVNTLKIDRSFLIDIATNKADQAIASSIIELARNLKLDVVAEGVETDAQLDQIVSRGCYVIQGYYFSKPIAAPALEAYIAAKNHAGLPASAPALLIAETCTS